MEKYLLLIMAILIGSIGQILLKIGVNQSMPLVSEVHSLENLLSAVFIFLKNYKILSAIFLYSFGFFLWLFILTKFELSYIFPLTAAVYVTVMLVSWIFLKENVTTFRVIGTIIIAIGVYFVAKS